MRLFLTSISMLLAGLFAGLGGPASACEVPALAGVWENPHANVTQDLTRLEIAHVCQSELSGGRAVLAGTTWTVRAFSKCSPRDCKWGRERAEIDGKGRLVVIFPTFSARRTLHISAAGHAVYVDVEVDYHDERTKDRKEKLLLVAAD